MLLPNTYLSLAVMMSSPVFGRFVVEEKRHFLLSARRFGQEHPPAIDQIAAACAGGSCDTLAGQAISTLLAASPECDQQNFADSIIDAANLKTLDTEKTAMIAAAIAFRQAEKNTPPDFTTNPPTNRNSVFCQTAPKNAQLNGLIQAQDPANGPEFFFDPATKATVKLGAQANTVPFGASSSAVGGSSGSSASSAAASTASTVAATTTTSAAASPKASETACVASTVTVTGDATATASSAAVATTSSTASTGTNLQTFTGNLGGVVPPPVTQVGSSFAVEGNATFNSKQDALVRSCDVQHNQCANAFNAGSRAPGLSVEACGTQQTACDAAAGQ